MVAGAAVTEGLWLLLTAGRLIEEYGHPELMFKWNTATVSCKEDAIELVQRECPLEGQRRIKFLKEAGVI